ncbi:hypothetical protein OHA40_14195 [Nocardia sp. NBC_00508]|uniref:hypothetical protein n=1 Tax=Nocardia sp. NBC_00508 TaxID=2975992 RepID=UPI002E8160B1|nr:hypothetical protein [Nocardia sp. NBC_00508]WUD69174.1 hypothetical protein OHA40_14195 [Nocardia sp. NBC_00508]
MATGVGLRVAEHECTAVIVTDGDEEPRYIVRESILHMSDDGDTVLGGPAPTGHSHSITGFVPAVGDPAGISVDEGEAYRAEDLVATALFCLINLAAEHLSGAAEFYATHPADWPAEDVRSLREALDYLGLRSVLLVSEGELPSAETGAAGGSFAHDAARGALAAVLATPAGATPPDPSTAENSTIDTIVIPAVSAADAPPQAYSAAIPIAEPIGATEPASPAKVTQAPAPAREQRRTPLLVAVAALLGLVLGGIVVAVLFRDSGETPVPPLPDAKSEQTSVTPSPPPPSVVSSTVPTTTTEEPEPPVVSTETTPPETAVPTTTEPPTTTPPTTSTSTTRTTTTTRNPFPQLPQIPTIPGMGTPGSR